MNIAPDCLRKVEAIGQNAGRGFADIFRAMATELSLSDDPSQTLVVPMYDETSGLKPGEYAAEIHFVLRKVA